MPRKESEKCRRCSKQGVIEEEDVRAWVDAIRSCLGNGLQQVTLAELQQRLGLSVGRLE